MSVDSSSVLLCCWIIVVFMLKKFLFCKKFVEPVFQCQSLLVQKKATISEITQVEIKNVLPIHL